MSGTVIMRCNEHPVATLTGTILGSSVAFIDGSVVNVALPAIAANLDTGATGTTWMISAYLLPVGALTLLGGALGDHYGQRRMFLCGLLVFTVASLVCGLAPSLWWLLAARGLQGVGAAILLPNSLALLGSCFDGAARGKAVGTWAAAGAILSAVGPLVGGWLVDTWGWRTIFFINMPLTLVAAALALRFVAVGQGGRKMPLDWMGGLLATLALLAIALALTWASEPSPSRLGSAVMAVGGCLLLATFAHVEVRKGKNALIPTTLFSTRPFIGLSLVTLFLYAALGGLAVLLPYILIVFGGYSAVAAGAAMLPLPLAIGIGSPLVGRLGAWVGARLLLGIGSGAVALGLGAFLRIGPESFDYWSVILPAMLAVSIGMMLCVAPLTTAVIEAVDRDHVGAASGLNSAIARVGGLLATAALGLVFEQRGSVETFHTAFRVAVWCGVALAMVAAGCVTFIPPNEHRPQSLP